MKKKRIYLYGLLSITICSFIIILLVNATFSSDTSIFFSENERSINTSSVTSYTVFDDNNNSKTYKQEDKKFDEIENILSSAQVVHSKDDIYLYGKKSERIVLKSKSKKITFVPYNVDSNENIILILKDFCENKDTVYFLDNHDYLITYISLDDYNSIFK